MSKKLSLSYLEIPVIILAFFAGWYLLGHYALGGPLSTDITVYMNVGMNHIENTFILNRYFHVFLEVVFLKLAPTPLIGFQYFWAFLMAATALLVYYNTRSFTSRSNFIHGLLAVGIFFSFQFFAQTAGIAYVDITAMFMVMVVVTIFMVSARWQHRSKWILILLGALFYLAFKTKETTLISGLLFIGLGFQDGEFQFKAFLKNIAYLLVGIVVGIIFFAMLSWIILGDPFFGLRPKEFYDFFMASVRSAPNATQEVAVLGNWYTAFFLQVFYIPFILFILAGIKPNQDLDLSHRLIWCLPLGLIIFVSLSANITWGPRFLLPAIPIICVLTPQFLNFEIPCSARERIRAAILFLIEIALILILRIIMRYALPKIGLDTTLFFVNIYESAILSIILAISFLWKRFITSISIVVAVLILALIASPIVSNVKMMLKSPNRAESDLTFYPYSSFSEEIHFQQDMKMFVSFNAWKVLGVSGYCNTLDDVLDLFNIYFNASSTRNNFTVSSDPTLISSIVTSTSYSYILISEGDWQAIPDSEQSILEQRYIQIEDKQSLLVFLQAK